MFSKTKIVAASVLVIMLLAVGVGGSIALAQGPTPTPPAPPKSPNWGQLYLQTLANKLGVSVEKLQQALTDARKDTLSEAVKQGLLTQAQADRLQQGLQRWKNMRRSMPFGFGAPRWGNAPRGTPFGWGNMPRGMPFGWQPRWNMTKLRQAFGFFGKTGLDAAAKALGMTTDEVTTALRGKTLADLAKEKKVDEAKIKQAIVDAEKAALDQAVKDGKITQARADALKAKLDPNKIDLSRRRFAPGQFRLPFRR